MDKEIEVGDYVRYEGEINRIEQIGNNYFWTENGLAIGIEQNSFNKYKHSKNIIDLVEVGDIVNGYRILEIEDSIYKNAKRILIYRDEKVERWIYIRERDCQDDIEEILTHEQYDDNKFEVVNK